MFFSGPTVPRMQTKFENLIYKSSSEELKIFDLVGLTFHSFYSSGRYTLTVNASLLALLKVERGAGLIVGSSLFGNSGLRTRPRRRSSTTRLPIMHGSAKTAESFSRISQARTPKWRHMSTKSTPYTRSNIAACARKTFHPPTTSSATATATSISVTFKNHIQVPFYFVYI